MQHVKEQLGQDGMVMSIQGSNFAIFRTAVPKCSKQYTKATAKMKMNTTILHLSMNNHRPLQRQYTLFSSRLQVRPTDFNRFSVKTGRAVPCACWKNFYWRYSNAKMEGFNNKIRWLIKQAYGFRDREYFKLKIYQLPEISSSKEIWLFVTNRRWGIFLNTISEVSVGKWSAAVSF